MMPARAKNNDQRMLIISGGSCNFVCSCPKHAVRTCFPLCVRSSGRYVAKSKHATYAIVTAATVCAAHASLPHIKGCRVSIAVYKVAIGGL